MTIGEHLDELRTCVVRSLLALAAAILVCIWPARFILAWTVKPLILALREHGQPDSLLATSPTEPLIWYVKIVLFLALVLASPFIIIQLWSFVAKGLYRTEQRLVTRMVPISVGLFLGGVAFMYTFVLWLSLNFLVGFSSWLPLPSAQPTAIQQWFGATPPETAASQPAAADLPDVPLFETDPQHPGPGTVWFNLSEYKLKVQGDTQTYAVPFQRDDRRGMVTNHIRIGEYLSFVLVLAVAFGLAFQVPLVVLFLVRARIIKHETMGSYRKIVYFTIVVIAAMLAPPDLVSHLLLSGPMILLFEIGMLIARPRKRTASS